MINTKKIKGRMVEKGFTQKKLASKLGIAQATLNQKINNSRPMSLNEVEVIMKELNITEMEFPSFFLAHLVA